MCAVFNPLIYPFSTASLNAKIPDGSTNLSRGLRYRESVVFNCSVGDNFFLLTPSLTAPLWFSQFEVNASYAPPTTGTPVPINHLVTPSPIAGTVVTPAEDGLDDFDLPIPVQLFPEPVPGSSYNYEMFEVPLKGQLDNPDLTTTISKWRLVSSAMRIILNNDSNTDGNYFEATRLSMGNVFDANLTSLKQSLQTVFAGTALDQPSYVCDRLSSIDKYTFQLKPDGMNLRYQSPESYLSSGFDAILLKITCTDTSSVLIFDVVTNQEAVYTADSPYSVFHTESCFDPNYQSVAAAGYIDIPAAVKGSRLRSYS